jgi:hypothetical protein
MSKPLCCLAESLFLQFDSLVRSVESERFGHRVSLELCQISDICLDWPCVSCLCWGHGEAKACHF